MAKDVLPFVFLDIAIVIVVARLMVRLFVRLRQPAVIGEILGGIVLGPSVPGLLPGNLPQVLFPTDVRPHLTVIAQLGLVRELRELAPASDDGLRSRVVARFRRVR